MEQLTEEICCKLAKFIKNEQTFSQDFYISATEPLLQLENLLHYCRLYLPHRPDVVEMLEYEREQLFEWAHIGNGEKSSDAETISEARGRTKGFAMRLVNKLRLVTKMAREELISQKPTETEQKTTLAKRRRIWSCVKRIPHWIYFLAALLTCIYLLWWLLTEFWPK